MKIGVNASALSTEPLNNYTYNEWRGTPSDSAYNWPDDGHSVDTSKYMRKFRVKTGIELDFPTEAQWEYACRAGTDGMYCDGSSTVDDVGWNNTSIKVVGLLKPNAWGLYDMHGNVWDWCLDQYQTHPSEPQIDPKGATDNISKRVIKGGSQNRNTMVFLRSAGRRQMAPSSGSDPSYGGFIGARLCCPITGVAE